VKETDFLLMTVEYQPLPDSIEATEDWLCTKDMVEKEPEIFDTLLLMSDEDDTSSIGKVTTTASGNERIWVTDPGATNHVTGVDQRCVNYRAFRKGEHRVRFAKYVSVDAKGVGDIALMFPRNNQPPARVILRRVLHVPECSSNNLLSVYQLLLAGYEVDYNSLPSHPVMITEKKTGAIVAHRCIRHKTFCIVAEDPEKHDTMINAVYASGNEGEVMKWHNRLGHLAVGAVTKAVRLRAVAGIETTQTTHCTECICDGCIPGKMTKTP
jgi:hypothetical protein